MKQAARFGTVELRGGKLTILGHVVNSVDIRAGPSPLPRVAGCHVGGAVALCKSAIAFMARRRELGVNLCVAAEDKGDITKACWGGGILRLLCLEEKN